MKEKFPVLNSTLSPAALGGLIRQQYGLSDTAGCRIFRLAMNHLYIVHDGGEKYVFRVYTHQWRTRPEVEEELRLLTLLKEAGRPVAFPVTDQSGACIQEIEAPEGTRYGVLFSYAKGIKTARFSAETSFLIGQALAKVHQSTENLELKRMSYTTETLLRNPVSRTKAFYHQNIGETGFLERLSDFLALKMEAVDPGSMRYGAVHLDVWFDNLHIDDEKDVTFFDFDFCGNGYLCFDISYFLFQLFATHLKEEDYEAKAAGFIKGYETVTEISEEEKKFLPYACLAVMTYYISVQCDRFDYWTNIFLNEDHLKRMTGNLKRWMAYQKIGIE